MNHRYGSRLAVQLDVIIQQQGQQLGRYQTRDISPYGVFLETGTLDIRLGSSLDLTFILSERPEERRHIQGMVIRRTYDGAGIMLSDHYCQIFLSLKQPGTKSQQAGQRTHHAGVATVNKSAKSARPLVSGQPSD